MHGSSQAEAHVSQTDARGGSLLGIALGLLLGALVGYLAAGPFHLVQIGPLTGAAVGAGLGLPIGLLAGALAGIMNADKGLEDLKSARGGTGGVVATVEVDGATGEESIQRVFAAHGAL